MKKLLSIIYLILILSNVYSQCAPMPPQPLCTGVALTDGMNINTGNSVFASSGNWTNINLNGGDLYICSGNVIISNFNLNSGKLYILETATFSTDRNTFGSGVYVYNYGVFNLTNGLMINSSSAFMNSGSLNVNGDMKGNGTTFTNYGDVNITGTLGDWQNSGGLCLEQNSTINTTNIVWNSLDNWVTGNAIGKTCISYTGTATSSNFHTFSSNSSIQICRKGSAMTGNGTWGLATINYPCVNCSVALPIELSEFYCKENKIYWTTESEENNDFFTVLNSDDGIKFFELNKLYGAGNSVNEIKYSINGNNSNYYKLLQTDFDGKSTESKIISCKKNNYSQLLIYPNPSKLENIKIKITVEDSLQVSLKIIDLLGQELYKNNIFVKPGEETILFLNKLLYLNPGKYYIILESCSIVKKQLIIIE